MTGRRHAEDGFTLVEVLVSLAILAIMLTYAIQSFFYFGKARQQADAISAQAEVDAAADLLRRELSGAVPVYRLDDQGRPLLRFKGEAEAIEFVILSSGDRETGGLVLVRYFVDDRNRLVSERRVLRDSVESAPETFSLLNGVEALHLDYVLGGKNQTAWTSPDRLPQWTRIKVEFVSGDGRLWNALQTRVAAGQQ
jgi:general secretion pathway protein J